VLNLPLRASKGKLTSRFTVITKLNLATNPFRNRTTPYLLSLILLTLGAVGALLALSQWYATSRENEIARKQVEEMEVEVKRLNGEGLKVQQQLKPHERELLVASHKLVANKAFGWSRLFADLESVLPGGVSASRLAVENVYRDGDRVKAELEFGVLSRDYQSVMEMIGTMNNSGLFQAELRGQDLQQNERVTFTEYTLRLIYTPAYGYSTAASNEVAQAPEGGEAR
jgi:Tfp pilus assembly protein PilN